MFYCTDLFLRELLQGVAIKLSCHYSNKKTFLIRLLEIHADIKSTKNE